MAQVTSVASFVAPLSQFEPNESTQECVFYGCVDIFYCGPPNGQPSGTAEEIDQLADQYYVKYAGANVPSNENGASLPTEYNVLKDLGLAYFPLQPSLAAIIASLQNNAYPVLLTGPERTFSDTGLGRVPYAWNTEGLNHCIVVCGVSGAGNLLVRDYANLEAEPGSVREYDATKIQVLSATAVRPRFIKMLPSPPPPPPQSLLEPTEDDLHVWNLLHADIAMVAAHGIPQSWLVGRWKHGFNFGSALEAEQDMTAVYKSAHTIIEQEFSHARASWHGDTGLTTWYDGRGKIADL